MRDAFCQTSDREASPNEIETIGMPNTESIKRTYDHRRATDSLLRPTDQKAKEANPLMVRVLLFE